MNSLSAGRGVGSKSSELTLGETPPPTRFATKDSQISPPLSFVRILGLLGPYRISFRNSFEIDQPAQVGREKHPG